MPQKSLIVLSVLVLCLHHSFASLSIHQLSPHISEAASCTSNNECGFGECQDGECVCYDMEHYWPSEGCSTYHDAPELEEGQWCTPNVNNAWCSYLGTCNAEGTACECDDAPHRLSQDRCAVFYSPPPLEDDQWCNPDLTNAWCSYLGTCNSDGSECICVEQPHRISADRCAEWHDVIPPTSVPTPASEVRSCLRVVAYDQFGDGWEDIAKLYYWGQSYPTGQEFDELSGTLSLNGCESIATVECLPVAEGVNHDYYFSLRGFDDMTEIESLPQYYWDILYSVQVVDTNGTVVSETLGGFNSTIVYRYDVASEDYSLVFAQNTNGEPVLNSCGVNDIFPEDVLLPESATCADITVQTTGTISASAMNTLSGRYRAPAWYITDSVSKNVLYAYGSSWGPLPVTVCETCLDDGQYIFRSTGAYNPASDDVSWSFCGVSSTRQSELRFEIINGECVVDSLLELSGVCGYLYAGQCAANTECNLGTCTDGECVCNDPVHYWASENCAVYHERVTSSPTHAPSVAPSGSPSSGPTVSPTSSPTVHLQSSSPTFVAGDHTSSPSSTPTHAPTMSPTTSPTLEPGTTHKPTSVPSLSPTVQSTNEPTMSPTTSPTLEPGTTHKPTSVPSTNEPTTSPTMSPTTSPTLVPGTTHEPTSVPSLSPTVQSTNEPTISPTMSPTTFPTLEPGTTHKPTSVPSLSPTVQSTNEPTTSPTMSPTTSPTLEPGTTHKPTSVPSLSPTVQSTNEPTTSPTMSPTTSPTLVPGTTHEPTSVQSTNEPTTSPTMSPTTSPTLEPGTTHKPTSVPSLSPTVQSTNEPTTSPTMSPTTSPTLEPGTTHIPTSVPSLSPTVQSTNEPTTSPTMSPTTSPTLEPGTTHIPTSVPSPSPTVQSTNEPTTSPTMSPTTSPTLVPGTTHKPTSVPSLSPTVQSTNEPTTSPTMSPMTSPTLMPGTTHEPTSVLSLSPTVQSTNEPTMSPTTSPTLKPGTIHKPTSGPTHELFPTISPSSCPTVAPTISPTVVLSSSPSLEPEITHMPSSAATTTSSIPTIIPTCSPTVLLTYTPSLLPISSDTASPSSFPSVSPTTFPSSPPTVFPTSLPTSRPTLIPGTTHAPTSLFLADERASLCGFLGTTNLGSLVSSGALSGWSCVDEQANPCIGWTGISCNGGRISGVDLSGIGITGTIPDSIGGLSELSYMDVSRNFLVGPLPESLGNLTKLTNLFLQENNFGSVERRLSNENPESRRRLEDIENDAEVIENLVSLSYLNIGGNGYTGPIPSSLCSIPLQTLVVTAISESSYLPNQFSCIASCLAENSQLVLTIPADVPICVVEPPTNAPTIAAGALAGNNVSQNTGNTSIAITVGTCLLFLMFLGCIFCRNRMQHKKHERELELAVSRDVIKHEKGSGELHLHRLGSMSSSDSDEESNGTNEYTVKSGTSRSKRRQGYGKVPSMPIEWSDKDNFKGEKPHNDDDSFPIVIDFSDSGTNDRDDITEAIFGQKSVQSPSGNHKRGIVMRTDTKDIFKLHDSTDDGDDDGNTSCTRSQRDTVDMAAGSGDTYSGMSEIDMQSRSSYFSGSESRNSYTATSYTDTQNSYTTGSYTTGTYTTGSYIGNSLGRSSYTSYTGSASTPFEKLVTTGNTGHISSKEPTQTSNTLGDGLSRSDVATKAPSHTNTQLSRDAETATSFTGDTYSASTYASVGPSQADDTWFTSDTFARQSYDSRDPSYDSRDGYSASSYTYTDPRGSRDNYTASSYTDTRDPRDSVMSQSSLGSYTRTSYTDTRDPRDSVMSQSSLGSYTRTSYTDTRDPRDSMISQSSMGSYTRTSYTDTRDPRDSMMSQSSMGSYTRTSYTDTRDPRDSMMSQSSMGSYTRTSYTDTRDPRGSYTSQSSADSYTRDSYTATSYSQSIPSTYPHIDTGVGFTSNPMNRHTVIGQMSPFPMERTENNDAPLSSSPDQSATRNPMMRHTYAGTTAAASHIPFSDHSSGAQNPGLPPSGAVRPDGVTAPSNPSADDQFDEQPRIVALPGLPPRVPLTRQQSSDTRDSFSLGDISELTDDFRSQSPRGKSGKLFYL